MAKVLVMTLKSLIDITDDLIKNEKAKLKRSRKPAIKKNSRLVLEYLQNVRARLLDKGDRKL